MFSGSTASVSLGCLRPAGKRVSFQSKCLREVVRFQPQENDEGAGIMGGKQINEAQEFTPIPPTQPETGIPGQVHRCVSTEQNPDGSMMSSAPSQVQDSVGSEQKSAEAMQSSVPSEVQDSVGIEQKSHELMQSSAPGIEQKSDEAMQSSAPNEVQDSVGNEQKPDEAMQSTAPGQVATSADTRSPPAAPASPKPSGSPILAFTTLVAARRGVKRPAAGDEIVAASSDEEHMANLPLNCMDSGDDDDSLMAATTIGRPGSDAQADENIEDQSQMNADVARDTPPNQLFQDAHGVAILQRIANVCMLRPVCQRFWDYFTRGCRIAKARVHKSWLADAGLLAWSIYVFVGWLVGHVVRWIASLLVACLMIVCLSIVSCLLVVC